MEKQYYLHELDCANCANKIERKIQKLSTVKEASVSFANKQMFIDVEEGFDEQAMIDLIHDLEPEVFVEAIMKGKKPVTSNVEKEHHDHEYHDLDCCGGEHGGCCGDDHKHEGCGCHDHEHDHEEDHHHEHHEGCDCGHNHEEHVAHAVNQAITYQINNLDCASCAAKVERAVCEMQEVEDASVNFAASKLAVRFKSNIDPKQGVLKVQSLVKKLEPEVEITDGKMKATPKKNTHAKEWMRLAVGVVFFALGLYFKETNYAVYLFLVAFIISGGKVVLQAARNIMRKEVFDENFLMSIATIGAFLIGDYAEGVAVMLFYEVGELFQSIAVNRSRQNISDLMDIRADYANLLVDGVEKQVDPEMVHVDDIIRLKPGERVPLDGVLLSMNASMDTSALSGESLPRESVKGDEVLAGSVNLSQVVEVRVTRELQESTVSRILELVQNAGNRKAPMEKFITKFARYYTPMVVLAAVLLAIIPPLLGWGAFEVWLYRALTFLVVSCPCALVVSIPLGLFAGIGGASRKGILVKGGNYLEALKDIDTVVFDKTGTLTKGVFKVQEILGENKDQILELAAHGESFSSHPIARSILEAYGKTVDEKRINNVEELSGHGIKAMIDGQEVLLGNYKLMQDHQIQASECQIAGTVVYVAVNQVYLGCIVIADEVKPTSAKAIQALKQAGVRRTVMLSGDRNTAVMAVKEQLGLDVVYGELLPQHKVEKVEELIASLPAKGKLAFVGDGINDAPVIARADIGFAMGGIGSDAAIEAADVVLMKDDPLAISEAIAISRKTKAILWQNVIFSLGVKGIVLVMSGMGYATMWMGVFADVGVTLIAVINAMRALRA